MTRLPTLSLAVSALALVAADPPPTIEAVRPDANPVVAKFDEFAVAALACTEATRSEAVSTQAIEKRGWTEYPQKDPEVAKLVATFSRPDSHMLVSVLKQKAQCDVSWPVSTQSGPDALFALADNAVSKTLSGTYRKNFKTLQPPPIFGGRAHAFMAGDSIAIVGVQATGGVTSVEFSSLNNGNLKPGLRSEPPKPSQESQGH